MAKADAKDAPVEGVIVGVRGAEAGRGIQATAWFLQGGRSGLVFVCKKGKVT